MTTSTLRVLTYHRVLDPADPSTPRPASISAGPAAFEQQMRHLAKRYAVVTAEEVVTSLREARALPRKAVLVTFDDAYCDFGDVAWPILRRCQVPATLFVPTAYPDNPAREFWWDRLHRAFRSTVHRSLWVSGLGRLTLDTAPARAAVLRRLEAHLKAISHAEAMETVDLVCERLGVSDVPAPQVLGWSALRELARDGVTLAPHTRTHPSLPRLGLEEARAEIRGSREDLEREVGAVLPVFAYPFGAHDGRVVRLLREERFEMALTCIDGHNQLASTDPLRLRRTNVSMRTSVPIFRARLHPMAAVVDRWRHRHARSDAATL